MLLHNLLPTDQHLDPPSITMNFFRKKEQTAIPPVSQPSAPAPQASRYTPQTYVPSRDAGKFDSVAYSAQQQRGAGGAAQYQPSTDADAYYGDRYARNRGVGDSYSRTGGDVERDRNELFAGYNPQKSGSGRFFDGPDVPQSESAPGQETEEDIEGIKTQTRFVKQESVNSTRNALRLAREAEETARNTLGRLGDQSGEFRTYCIAISTLN